jgi:hypothetical protein
MDGLTLDVPPGLSAERARCIANPGATVEAERRLLETLRDQPGLTSRELMRLVDTKRGSTLDRLQRLQARGAIEKDGRGWRLRDERSIAEANEEEPEPERIEPEPEPQPIEPEPGAQSRWIKPLSCYERRETTVVEGLRYG